MFIPQNHPKSQQRVRTCAVIEKPVFRASLALSMLEIELYQISLPYDRGRSGYEITGNLHFLRGNFSLFPLKFTVFGWFLCYSIHGQSSSIPKSEVRSPKSTYRAPYRHPTIWLSVIVEQLFTFKTVFISEPVNRCFTTFYDGI